MKEHGYGRACAAAAEAANPDCDIIVLMDGDGADRADMVERLIVPLQQGSHDFVIAARARQLREPHSMSVHQVAAGHILGFAIGMLTGMRYTDMCAFRAIRRDELKRLEMKEMTYGWNIEMQIKAAQRGLRVLEIPLPYRCRAGGKSKAADSVRGTIRASWRIVMTFVRVASSGRSARQILSGIGVPMFEKQRTITPGHPPVGMPGGVAGDIRLGLDNTAAGDAFRQLPHQNLANEIAGERRRIGRQLRAGERASDGHPWRAARFQGIRSTHCAREGPGLKGPPKY